MYWEFLFSAWLDFVDIRKLAFKNDFCSITVAFQLINHLPEVVKSAVSISIRTQHTLKLDASVQPVFILEAPMTARVPMFWEKDFPVC